MKAPLFLSIVLLAPLVAFAQSTEPIKTKALSFNINGLTLSGLNGGMGGKVWIPGNRALVGSVDGSFSTNSTESDDPAYVDDTDRSWEIVAHVGMEQHFAWQPGFSPYLTGGLFLGQSGSRSESGLDTDLNIDTERNLIVGGRAGFGIEYWVTPRISLAGQQLVVVSYSAGEQKSSGFDAEETGFFSVGLGTSSVILSVYF